MPESRKRGGKKAHNARVKKRNQFLQQQKVYYTKLFNEKLKEAIEKRKNEDSNNQSI